MDDIEKLINEYDIILLVEDATGDSNNMKDRIEHSDVIINSNKKVKVITAKDNPDVASLFYMYEFSDKVRFVGRSGQFGGLCNLIDSGLISEEEVLEALVL